MTILTKGENVSIVVQWQCLTDIYNATGICAQSEANLARKMLFITGPQQVGKTTLGLSLANANAGYLHWELIVTF